MSLNEGHRTEYNLIEDVISELTQVLKRIETLSSQLKDVEEQLFQEMAKGDALSKDLERITAERNQLQADIKDMEENMREQMAIRDTKIDELQNEVQRETAERKDAVELLRKSFSQIQDLMNSAQHIMDPKQ